MEALCKASHKVFRIKYHFVFCIKYRKGLFLGSKYVDALGEICKGIESRFHLVFEMMGFDEDHVHFMLQAVPEYSPSRVFQIVKSITAKQLFKAHPEVKEDLWGGEFWSDGGYVGTVGEGVNAEVIRNYIKKQGQKETQLKLIEFT
jgi:putative transposase